MPRKLASYLLISLLSFSVATTLFHTVANAETSEFIIAAPSIVPQSSPSPVVTPSAPTPTTPVQKKPPVLFTMQSVELPSPTATPVKEEPTPTATPVQKTNAVEPTASPLLTAVPTTEPIPTATPAPKPAVVAPADLDPLFSKYADEYQIDKEDLKRIAKCEAGFNPNADTGLYAGMYQFAAATWISTRNAMGLDSNPDLRKNAEESIKTAAFKIKNGGRGAWPNC